MKLRFKVRLIHLLLFVAAIAVGMWYLTVHNKRRCVAVIDKYRIVERESESLLQIRFHFTEPAELSGEPLDLIVNEIPKEHFPDHMAAGDKVIFRYQAEPTWLYEEETAIRKFWDTVMVNEANISPDISEKLFSQILVDFGIQQ